MVCHALRQLDPDLKTHVLAVELCQLFDDKTIRVSTVAGCRQTCQQISHTQLPGRVAGMVHWTGCSTGNGAAGAQNHYFLTHYLQTFKNWIKIQLLFIKTVPIKDRHKTQ